MAVGRERLLLYFDPLPRKDRLKRERAPSDPLAHGAVANEDLQWATRGREANIAAETTTAVDLGHLWSRDERHARAVNRAAQNF